MNSVNQISLFKNENPFGLKVGDKVAPTFGARSGIVVRDKNQYKVSIKDKGKKHLLPLVKDIFSKKKKRKSAPHPPGYVSPMQKLQLELAECKGRKVTRKTSAKSSKKQAFDAFSLHKLVIPGKTTLPILECMLSINGKLISTNLDMTLITRSDVPDGLYFFVKNNLELDSKKTADEMTDFPRMDELDIKPISSFVIEHNTIDIIKRAAAFCSSDQLRPALTGILFSTDNKKLRITVTDGHTLMTQATNIVCSDDVTCIIGGAFGSLVKVLSKIDKMNSGNLRISIGKTKDTSYITFENDELQIISRLMDENYPDFKRVIPDESENVYSFSKNEMIAALEEITPYANPTTYQIKIEYTSQNQWTLIAIDPDRQLKKEKAIAISKVAGKSKINNDHIAMVMPVRLSDSSYDDKPGIGFNAFLLLRGLKSRIGDTIFVGNRGATNAFLLSDSPDSFNLKIENPEFVKFWDGEVKDAANAIRDQFYKVNGKMLKADADKFIRSQQWHKLFVKKRWVDAWRRFVDEGYIWSDKNNYYWDGIHEKPDNIEVNPTNIAINAILDQLGGSKFIVMTGVKNLLYRTTPRPYLQMDIPGNAGKVNRLEITLDSNDTYTMKFYHLSKNGLKISNEKTFKDKLGTELQSVFSEVTGMDTTLGTFGRHKYSNPITSPTLPVPISGGLALLAKAIVMKVDRKTLELNHDLFCTADRKWLIMTPKTLKHKAKVNVSGDAKEIYRAFNHYDIKDTGQVNLPMEKGFEALGKITAIEYDSDKMIYKTDHKSGRKTMRPYVHTFDIPSPIYKIKGESVYIIGPMAKPVTERGIEA